jgi:hypothetical protein
MTTAGIPCCMPKNPKNHHHHIYRLDGTPELELFLPALSLSS